MLECDGTTYGRSCRSRALLRDDSSSRTPVSLRSRPDLGCSLIVRPGEEPASFAHRFRAAEEFAALIRPFLADCSLGGSLRAVAQRNIGCVS